MSERPIGGLRLVWVEPSRAARADGAGFDGYAPLAGEIYVFDKVSYCGMEEIQFTPL